MTTVQKISDLPGLLELIAKNSDAVPVNSNTAQRHTAVFSCFKALSDDLSGLPVHVYQKKDNQVRKASEHPITDHIKLAPNSEMRAFSWYKARFLHAFSTGNSCVFIERSALNPVKNLWPLDPGGVTLERVGTEKGGRGYLRYVFQDGISKPAYYDPKDILHLKGYTWNGIWGQTAITDYAKTQVGIGLEMDQFQKAFFINGLNPGGVFKHPKSLGEKNKPGFMKALKKRFVGGGKKSKQPLVLEDGMDFVPYEIKMVDQQFIELLKLNKTDICGILGVPESRISISGSNTNYNNTEAERRRYMESALLPWAIPDEQEMTYRLLTAADRKAGFYIKYNFDGFLRGDASERVKTYRNWNYMGVPVNRLLEMEDMPPIDGGDVGLVQLALAPITEIGAIQHDKFDDGDDTDYTPGDDPAPLETKSKQIEKRGLKQIVKGRDRVKKRYIPLIKQGIEKIINRENIALTKQIKRQISERADDDFSVWVDSFYSTLPEIMEKNLRSIFQSYAETTQELVAGEIDLDEADFGEVDTETWEYLTGYITQYINASRGQIFQQLEDGGFEAVQNRVDEWAEKRTGKEVSELSVGIASMVARSVILGAGYSLVWKTRGKSCPMCNQLNGRKVSKKNQPFNKPTEEFTDDAGGTVTFRQTKYAPLHAGCDCQVVAG